MHDFYFKYLKKIIIFSFLFSILFNLHVVFAGPLIGTETTPTTYDITVTKIEFQNDQGSWVTFAQGNFTFDIASVGQYQTIGPIAEGTILPSDTYVAIRVTFLNSFGLTGSAINVVRLRTNTGNPANQVFAPAGLTGVGLATQDAAPATKQTIPIPTDGAMPALLAAKNITIVGGSLQFDQAVNFTVKVGMPIIQIDFDVTNSMEFRFVPAMTYLVIPLAPSITVTITE